LDVNEESSSLLWIEDGATKRKRKREKRQKLREKARIKAILKGLPLWAEAWTSYGRRSRMNDERR